MAAAFALAISCNATPSRVMLRVSAQLIDAATDAYLWAERFDRDTGDLFALQNEIERRLSVFPFGRFNFLLG
jgi:TolB-like protein